MSGIASHQATARQSPVTAALAKDRLGTLLVTGHALSGSAPMTVVAAGITTAFAVTTNPGLPIVYVAVTIALALFSVGYVAMSRHIVNAGSFYTYITHGLGRPLGVGSAFIAKVGYNLMQAGLYGGFGVVASTFASGRFGLDVAWWVWALGAWLLICLFGVLRIDINGLILGILLGAEIVLIVIYDLVMGAHPAPGGADLGGLSLSHLATASFGAAAVVAITGFVGFEATTVFSEEAKDPRRTIGRATYLSLFLVGALYCVSALAMTIIAGPGQIVALAAAHQANADLLFVLVSPHMHAAFIDAGAVLACTSLFAAGLAFHNTCARYAFSMARENVIFSALASTSLKTMAPRNSSLFQSAIGLIFIVVYGIFDSNPLLHLFFWLATWCGLAVLVLMVLTSFAVLRYFRTGAGRAAREGAWRTVVAPGLAIVALGYILIQTLLNYHNLLGVQPGDFWATAFPVGLAVIFAIGVAWALWLRKFRPESYERIGGVRKAAPATAPTPGGTYA